MQPWRLEAANPLVDAEETDDGEMIAEGAEFVDAGLAGKSGADDGVAGGADAAGGFEGEGALSGDEAEGGVGGKLVEPLGAFVYCGRDGEGCNSK